MRLQSVLRVVSAVSGVGFAFAAAFAFGGGTPGEWALVSPAQASSPIVVTDALGTQVRLSHSPARIVTLAPSIGELAAEFVGDQLERIVGVSEYTDYPLALAKTASIGPYHRINIEKVVALKPDLVLAWQDGNIQDQVTHLRELGVPVVVVATESFEKIRESMKLVGAALGDPQRGERMAAQFSLGLERIRARHSKSQARPKVLLQLGDEPLITVGKRAFLNDALEAVGAGNLFADLDVRYPRPSLETAVSRNPDVIVVLGMAGDSSEFAKMAARWSRFPKLPAVRARRVRVLRADALLRPSLRLLEGLSVLEKTIHGEGAVFGSR